VWVGELPNPRQWLITSTKRAGLYLDSGAEHFWQHDEHKLYQLQTKPTINKHYYTFSYLLYINKIEVQAYWLSLFASKLLEINDWKSYCNKSQSVEFTYACLNILSLSLRFSSNYELSARMKNPLTLVCI